MKSIIAEAPSIFKVCKFAHGLTNQGRLETARFRRLKPNGVRDFNEALYQELKAHAPREVAFVGGYALLDSPVIPFLEKIGADGNWRREAIVNH